MPRNKNLLGKGKKGLKEVNLEDGLQWTIQNKLIALFLLIGLVPLGAYSYITMNRVDTEIREINKNRLISLRDEKKLQIEIYFKSIQNQVLTFSEDIMVVTAMTQFSSAWNKVLSEAGHTYGDSQASKLQERYNYQVKNTHGSSSNSFNAWFPRNKISKVLQSLYISENSNPIGEKHRLDFANDGSTYSRVHRKFHPIIRNYLEKFGYYDIFLVDAETGYIMYTVFKEVDFTTSLYNGPYAETGIGRAFQAAANADNKNFFFMDDFEPYEPSYNAAAAFISSPIYDKGEKIGVLIFQAPVDKINAVMTSNNSWEKTGLGKSGEVYMVGADFKMRNNSRFLIEDTEGFFRQIAEVGVAQETSEKIKALNTSIGLLEVRTKASVNSIRGITDFDIIPDYRNISVLSAYAPINIMGLKWGIMAEIDEEEAFTVQETLIKLSLQLATILIAFSIFFAAYLSGLFSKPIMALVKRAQDVVGGNLRVDPLRINTTDELGLLGRSFNILLDRLQDFIMNSENILAGKLVNDGKFNQEGDFLKSLEGMRDQAKKKLVTDKREKEMTAKMRAVLENVTTSANSLTIAAESLTTTSQKMASNAEETSAQAVSVSAASEQVSQSVETVATGSEEMSSSIKEIASNTTEAATVAAKAVDIAKKTNKMIQDLGLSSKEIDDVIRVITSIAEQTNLLALNATIEAARAGEAGKGFAVVANEVKELAIQTAEATESISKTIQNIQSKTSGSVDAIGEITNIIHKIDDISNTIASSVKEQTATTAEIGNSVAQAAKGSGNIATNITGVAQAAKNTADGADEVRKASSELSRMAIELEKIVGRFQV